MSWWRPARTVGGARPRWAGRCSRPRCARWTSPAPPRWSGRRPGGRTTRRTSAGWSRPACPTRRAGSRSPRVAWPRWTGSCGSCEPTAPRRRCRPRSPSRPAASSASAEVTGAGEPERELVLPYRGQRLRGDGIRRRVEAWVAAGVAEPSLVEPVEDVLAHPEWLRLDGITVAALGAAAEMGPVPSLLRWGATVAAVDLPRPALWEALRRVARAGAGRLLIPVDPRHRRARRRPAHRGAGDRRLAGRAARPAGAGHLRVRRREPAPAAGRGGRRAGPAAAASAAPTWGWRSWPRRPTRSRCRARRSSTPPAPTAGARSRPRLLRPPLRAVSRGRLLAAAVPAGRGPRRQRQPDPAAGAELRAGEADPALAGRGRPGRRHAGVLPRRPVRADPLGGQAPGTGRGLQRRAPLRRGGLRAGDGEHAAGRAARARPAHRAGAAAPTRGRTRRTRPSTVDCGGPRTRRAACSASPRCSGCSAAARCRPRRSAGGSAGRSRRRSVGGSEPRRCGRRGDRRGGRR